MKSKIIIFDWFVLFKFNKHSSLGEPIALAKYYLKKLKLNGWEVYVKTPSKINKAYTVFIRHLNLYKFPVINVIYDLDRIVKKCNNTKLHISNTYFNVCCGIWLKLWFNTLREYFKEGV